MNNRRFYQINQMKLNLLFILFMISFNTVLFAQEDSLYKIPVIGTFRNTQLINAQTTEMLAPKGYEFKIQHRFGKIDKQALNNFFGLDLPANIRFSFSFPVTRRISTGIGRTKNSKLIDWDAKYLIMQQTEKNERPVSIALYFDVGLTSQKVPVVPVDAFFADMKTPFVNKFSNRISYTTELIISRKISERISVQVSPIFVYQNLVGPGLINGIAVVQGSGRYKFSETSNTSIIFEYAYIITNRKAKTIDPLSIGFEYGTAGHVFQLVLSSTDNILDQSIYTKANFDYTKGNFVLGFNIKRITWRK